MAKLTGSEEVGKVVEVKSEATEVVDLCDSSSDNEERQVMIL